MNIFLLLGTKEMNNVMSKLIEVTECGSQLDPIAQEFVWTGEGHANRHKTLFHC